MILIFAVDNNWNIGFGGEMLTAIPSDLTRFREFTEGNIIIMGRKTLEALPDGNPLPNRINILITRNKDYKKEGLHIINSLEDLPSLLERLNPDKKMKEFVIGGGNIVIQLLSKCNKAYITKILKSFEKVDTCIPNLDLEKDWKIVKESEVFKENNLEYKYVDYIKLD